MAAPAPQTGPVGPDTLITCKVLTEGTNRRFKLALRDLSANTLPQKLRFLLAIPPERDVKFDRFSDSAGAYVSLDSTNPAVYKQLYRAAKAKLKLRLRATVLRPTQVTEEETTTFEQEESSAGVPRQSSYLETVLSYPPAPTAESVAESQESTPVRTFRTSERAMPKNAPVPEPVQLSRPTLPSLHDFSCNIFSIDCNSCNNTIPNEHYHCSICEHGDFDLCQACVDSGATCHGDEHWLIKRMIKNGRIVPSITEIVPPKAVSKSAPVEEVQPAAHVYDEEERTCNSCINQFPATSFVTCKDCPDFDLCFSCFDQGEHGHHPAHTFHPAREQPASLSAKTKALCGSGRGVRHEAVCDGCDKQIIGTRHKCLSCPDFDYCSSCISNASSLHPAHRFVPVYEHLSVLPGNFRKEVHRGIYCDGVECASRARKTWIKGDRYKCAICHDTDFCANCEASPNFDHNKTHPLIKMRIPVHSINIATFDEHAGQTVQLGDRPLARHASTETTRSTSINAATQIQTVAEVKPVETKSVEAEEPVVAKAEVPVTKDLQAWFIVDSTPDGSTFAPDHLVSQSWTLRNPGPHAWPAGCAVYFTGGDDMRNLDMKNPSSVSDMTIANRSNILEHPLQPGQTAVFTVMLKSPPRECRAISYWRLKTPSGDAFGHKLWVDITVANKPNEKEVISAAPVPEPFQAEVDDQAQQSSTMIFPRLEKESPDSSIHNVAGGMSVTTAAETMAANHQKELIDDLESLTFDDYEATEDGFMTDEEYDILDADDEDGLTSADRIGA